MTPREVREMYLADREGDVREATHEADHYRTLAFVRWCDENGVDDLGDLDGRDLFAFKSDRAEDVAQTTLQAQLSTLRLFLRFAEDIDAVEDGLPEKVRPPTPEETARENRVEREEAEAILDRLARFDYASRDHALFLVAWRTAMRIGGLRSLDVEDAALDDSEQPHLKVRHDRDHTDLKNGVDGNRDVAISERVGEVLGDYIEEQRVEAEDDAGRRPLFSTKQGRLSEGWLRTTIYKLTQPCYVGECPVDGRSASSCSWEQDNDRASKCPESRPPHDVRRGSISDHLQRGWPIEELSERVNATPKVIRKHYDVRRARESMLTRSALLEDDSMNPPPAERPEVENGKERISDGEEGVSVSDGSARI